MRTEFPLEVSLPRDDCAEPDRWHARDMYATEEEVSHLLGALCVGLRPRRVLETGTYEGDSTLQMGLALVGYGHLDALEIDPERAERVRGRVAGLPVTVHTTNSMDFLPGQRYDFAFFDSDPDVRPREMEMFATPGGVWALHDTQWPGVQAQLQGLRDRGIITGWTDLPTPRGLAIGRYPRR